MTHSAAHRQAVTQRISVSLWHGCCVASLCARQVENIGGPPADTDAVARLHIRAPACPEVRALVSQARHGPPRTSSSMFGPFDAPLLFIPVFVYPPRRSLSSSCRPPARTSCSTSSCLSVWSSKPHWIFFFSAGSTGIWGDLIDTQHGFHCEQSQDLRYAV